MRDEERDEAGHEQRGLQEQRIADERGGERADDQPFDVAFPFARNHGRDQQTHSGRSSEIVERPPVEGVGGAIEGGAKDEQRLGD